MKSKMFYLISAILLLIPIATAESFAKFLYAHDDNDCVITEAYNVSLIKYEKFRDGISFIVERGGVDILKMDPHCLETNVGIAIEAFRNENRSWIESPLIISATKQIATRNLTGEERLQLEALQKRLKGKPNFKLTHEGRNWKTEACGFRIIMESTLPLINSTKWFEARFIEADETISDISLQNETLPDMSFVIERRVDRENQDCDRDEIAGLKVDNCRGIRLRKLIKND